MFQATIIVSQTTDVTEELRKLEQAALSSGLSETDLLFMLQSVRTVLADFVSAKKETAGLGISMHLERTIEDANYRIKVIADSSAAKGRGFSRLFKR